MDDSNILVQRSTLDLAIAFISFHKTDIPLADVVKILTYALSVFLRRDMSLNRRIFQWLLNVNSDGQQVNQMDKSVSREEDVTDEDVRVNTSYFLTYAKDLLTAAVIVLFQHVAYADLQETTTLSPRKPFRILISLLDKPEVGSAILEDVLIEVFRTLYQYYEQKEGVKSDQKASSDDSQRIADTHDELVKNANLLFNAFEPYYMWDYLGRLLKKCSKNMVMNSQECVESEAATESGISRLATLVSLKEPTHLEMFKLISYLLDVVSLVCIVLHYFTV